MPTITPAAAMRFWLKLFFSHNRQRLILGITLALATALSGMALLALSGWFITATAVAGAAIALGAVYMLDIYLPGGGIRFFALSRTLSRYLERLYNHDTVLRQLALSRVALFQGLQQLPRALSKQATDADWLSRLTTELDALDNLYLRLLVPPLIALLASAVFFAVLALWLPGFALAGFSLLLLFMLSSARLFCRQNSQLGSELAEQVTAARQAIIAQIDGIAELLTSNTLAHYQHPLWQHSARFFQLENSLQRWQSRWQLAINLWQIGLFVALISGVLYTHSLALLSGPVAVLFILGWLGVAELLLSLPGQYAHLGKTRYAATRLAALSQSEQAGNTQTDTASAARPLQRVLTHQSANNATFNSLQLEISRHPQIAQSFHSPLNLNFSASQPWILVCGRSGSGKSSIAKALIADDHLSPQTYPHDSGTGQTCLSTCTGVESIQINNEGNTTTLTRAATINNAEKAISYCQLSLNNIPLSAEQRRAYQQQIAYLEQENANFADTLRYNLQLGLAPLPDELLWQQLQKVELADWAKQLPQGLDTWLGDAGQNISGGQARRLSLARLMLRQPALIILDEPFNGLDNAMAARIWQAMLPWLEQRKVLLLLHHKPEQFHHIERFSVLDLDNDLSAIAH